MAGNTDLHNPQSQSDGSWLDYAPKGAKGDKVWGTVAFRSEGRKQRSLRVLETEGTHKLLISRDCHAGAKNALLLVPIVFTAREVNGMRASGFPQALDSGCVDLMLVFRFSDRMLNKDTAV